MNYRHIFHAGNPADVMKHAILAQILMHLRVKDTPFCVLDAHAGIGCYDLLSEQAGKTLEYQTGIGQLFDMPDADPSLAPYLDAVRGLNPDGTLHTYPGSPRLARSLMRDQDRLVAIELHPDDADTLREEFSGDRQVTIHQGDAYKALRSQLPPREKRGVVLLDPPFEKTDEFDRLADGLKTAHRRFANGIYAIWYPIKERAAVWRFHEAVENTGIPKILVAELTWHDEDIHTRLNGSGLLIVNPPWKLAETLSTLLPALHAALPSTGGGWKVDWLTPET